MLGRDSSRGSRYLLIEELGPIKHTIYVGVSKSEGPCVINPCSTALIIRTPTKRTLETARSPKLDLDTLVLFDPFQEE